MAIKRVGILYHPMVSRAHTLARELEGFLSSRGISSWLCSAWEEDKARTLLDGTDLILTTGGDGTILRASQVALPGQIPITGINLGKLGFMTELAATEAAGKLPSLLAGEGWVDERTLLEAELSPPAGDKEPTQKFHALNDVVVARGAIARLINIDTFINGEQLTTYRADGVIVATATGSTGYSLAAGGPILHPQSEDFLLVPILPHLGMTYSTILPPTAEVRLGVTTAHQATLSIDGHINRPLSSRAVVSIKRSSSKVRFLRIHPEKSFYSSLEQQLKGKKPVETGRKSQNQ